MPSSISALWDCRSATSFQRKWCIQAVQRLAYTEHHGHVPLWPEKIFTPYQSPFVEVNVKVNAQCGPTLGNAVWNTGGTPGLCRQLLLRDLWLWPLRPFRSKVGCFSSRQKRSFFSHCRQNNLGVPFLSRRKYMAAPKYSMGFTLDPSGSSSLAMREFFDLSKRVVRSSGLCREDSTIALR